MSIKRFVVIASVALAVLLGVVGAAGAATNPYTTDFDSFALGSVNGQEGWHSLPVPPALPNGYDQAIVSDSLFSNSPTTFGSQSLRLSNAYTSGEFANQTYSPSISNPASESGPNTVFDGSFDFISTSASSQPGLFISVSPDNGSGARMSYVSLEDIGTGIQLTFADTLDGTTFRYFDAGTYAYDKPVHVEFLIQQVPGVNADGSPNDIVRFYVNNVDIGDKLGECFTTWENYYRNFEKHDPGVINSFEFRAAGTAALNTLGGGYLFDNVSTEARSTGGPAPTTCGVPEVGQITPTGTTCQQYRDGIAPTLDQVVYATKSDQINSVSPGVFFYYTKFSGDEGQVVGINQTNNGTPDPYVVIPIQQGQQFLYDASSCTKVKWGDGLTLPYDGDFIMGTKYNPTTLKGHAPPVPATITYAFETMLDTTLVDTGATIDLAPKK